MVAMQWDQSLSVGVGLIDEQHKTLIQRINDLSDALARHEGTSKIIKTLEFLLDYTEYHFNEEQKYMGLHAYPGLADHKAKHDELKVTLGHLVGDFQDEGSTDSLAQAINVFLTNWLREHIRGTDVQFGRFLQEKGIVLG
jgi:hemerythrin